MAKKKSLEVVRPAYGRFQLSVLPGVWLEYRKITLDDMSWFKSEFGVEISEFFSGAAGPISFRNLCKIYLHHLTPESQAYFRPEKTVVVDAETGDQVERVVTGSEKLLRAMDMGGAELTWAGLEFKKTLLASRSVVELPDEVKKNLEQARKQVAEEETKTK